MSPAPNHILLALGRSKPTAGKALCKPEPRQPTKEQWPRGSVSAATLGYDVVFSALSEA